MMTPNSAATPASAMKPTPLATDTLCPSSHSSQMPPTSANGSAAMMSSASSKRRNVRYSSTKMISSVNGTTTLRRVGRALEVLELPRPRDRIAGRQLDLRGDRRLHVADGRT